MTAPSTYTETGLATFMVQELGKMAQLLDWTVTSPQVQEAVNDAVLSYGVAAIGSATDVAKLRAVARIAIWRKAVSDTAALYDYSAGPLTYNRGALQKAAKNALDEAMSSGWTYLAEYEVSAVPVRHDDPFDVQEWWR